MKSNGNGRGQEEIALERYKFISPVLTAMDEKADKSKIGLIKSEVCGQAGISRKTLDRWLSRYAEYGFDGLKYQGPVGARIVSWFTSFTGGKTGAGAAR